MPVRVFFLRLKQKHDKTHRRAGPDPSAAAQSQPEQGTRHESVTGEPVVVRRAPDPAALQTQLQAVFDTGIRSIAVVLKHAAIFPDHERLVGRVARAVGFAQVSLSHEVMQMVKMVPRGYTATADAYLTPHIMRYDVIVCA